ncbi:DotI/IcmL family type IV secretion protein [Pseudomonas sp. AB12(2023)]|uniref:DotI/IcmL family type IV secretion protein n=1 Tax=Pseudomonas sp. AB12(2023) TaxID=3048597 RepID=UPI002B2392B1|nr:DotI/IcmL family type IV secretion protein [Pseudomonas sp. AB12(2023)]MEB0221332.1 DotI/IcmL family type IV secretion protein [Pseudomonas sp. AB12(2023)]
MPTTHSQNSPYSSGDGFTEENRAHMDAMYKEVSLRLHQTTAAIDPAMRVEKTRKKIAFIAVSAVKLNYILAFAVVFLVMSNLVLGWFATHPDRQYFASDNGRIFPMIPLSQPYRKPGDVIQFAKDTLSRSFTMDFNNSQQQLEDNRYRYTRLGFKSYLDALQSSGVLDTVRKKRMNMSITAGTGVMVKDGVEDGAYVWFIEIPIEIRLTGQTTELPSQRFLATVRVERIPTLDSIEGIGVGQLITRPQ